MVWKWQQETKRTHAVYQHCVREGTTLSEGSRVAVSSRDRQVLIRAQR